MGGNNGYDYSDYIGKLDGGKVRVVPKDWIYAKKKRGRFEGIMDPTATDSADFPAIKSAKYRDKIDLVLDELSRREAVKYDNLMRIYGDLLNVYELKFQLDPTHFYTKSKAWLDLFNQELNLKKQIRSELRDMYRDTGLASKELRESLLEYKVSAQKYKLFSIEDVLD
jgi:hypothetical protein